MRKLLQFPFAAQATVKSPTPLTHRQLLQLPCILLNRVRALKQARLLFGMFKVILIEQRIGEKGFRVS